MNTARRRSRGFALFTLVGIFLVLLNSAEAAAKPQVCQELYQQRYLKEAVHKAMATTGGRSLASGGNACGFATGYASKSEAIRVALRVCRANAKKGKVRGTCKIINSK